MMKRSGRIAAGTWLLVTSIGLTAACGDDDEQDGPVTMRVRLENVSDGSPLRTAFSPGVAGLQTRDGAVFTAGGVDPGDGLEPLAEDGNPATLASTLRGREGVKRLVVFDVPQDQEMPGPIMPGEAYEFTITTRDRDARLFLASMLVESNDLFVAPDTAGLRLFDDGDLITGDRTSQLRLWDAGTEVDQAPGAGSFQAARQPQPDTGPAETGVQPFVHATRALPLATQLVDVGVEQREGGQLAITIENVSASAGAMLTPISPVVLVTHDDDFQLFTPGEPASQALERLAEDGQPAPLAQTAATEVGVGRTEVAAVTLQRQADDMGPAMPGESFSALITPDAAHPLLSFATMVVESNDAFVATPPEGVRLLDDEGNALPAADIERQIQRMLAVWDAGTEANQVPGVGPAQAPRQPAPNTGAPDPLDEVRLYADPTVDLGGEQAGGFGAVVVADVDDPATPEYELEVRVANTSNITAYPGVLTPVVLVQHDGELMLFDRGDAASDELERLAEAGEAEGLAELLDGAEGARAWVLDTPVGSDDAGPLAPNQYYAREIAVTPELPFVNVATMVVPSNDTFLALGERGVMLLDDEGNLRDLGEIANDLDRALGAWDAGTEANQAGAAGPDQAPRQASPDAGPPQGNGEVRRFDDPVWSYPPLSDLVRLTIERR